MAGDVKRPRRYDSTRRREQAGATRREILEAARRLFERDGYAATTIAAVAAEAGVAVKTVYLAFETKSGLLRALWHLLLRGDEAEVPMRERAWYREVLDEPDPRRALALTAASSRAVKERAAGLMWVIRAAADGDRDSAVLWARIQSEFHQHMGGIVAALDRRGALRPNLDAVEATDVLWTLNHPDLWHLLVGERGWTPVQWEAWFARSAQMALLDP